jgi:hypothetical protein
VGQIGGATTAVAAKDDFAYIGVGPHLVIREVSKPTLLAVLGQTDFLPGIAKGVALDKNYAYIAADWKGLCILVSHFK